MPRARLAGHGPRLALRAGAASAILSARPGFGPRGRWERSPLYAFALRARMIDRCLAAAARSLASFVGWGLVAAPGDRTFVYASAGAHFAPRRNARRALASLATQNGALVAWAVLGSTVHLSGVDSLDAPCRLPPASASFRSPARWQAWFYVSRPSCLTQAFSQFSAAYWGALAPAFHARALFEFWRAGLGR